MERETKVTETTTKETKTVHEETPPKPKGETVIIEETHTEA